VAIKVRYSRAPPAMLQPSQGPTPAWVRAYLLVGAAQGLAIAFTGFARPAHVVGFPLSTTPLNVRFVASFYLAGAVGLLASAAARRAGDVRIFLAGFTAVTALLLLATLWYWSTYTEGGVPYPWVASYVVEPVIGAYAIRALSLERPARPGRHRMSAVYEAEAVAFAMLGVVLAAAPGTAVRMWPWALTPVLARTYAAIFVAFALGAALAARERRPQAVRPFALASLALVGSTAVVSLVHHGKFDGGASTYVWAAALAAAVLGLGAAALAALRPERAA
jgi:phosphoglycerol transferase MdoB-like AlkP superfamily enzyme